MPDRAATVAKLSDYYRTAGIAASRDPEVFFCRRRDECGRFLNGNRQSGAEAHVGRHFGTPFRLVMVSMDKGFREEYKTQKIEDRTREIEALFLEAECRWNEAELTPYTHGTIRLIEALIPEEERKTPNVFAHFAMINSAKCTCETGSMDHVDAQLYRNCSFHTNRELEILEPDVVVSQGRLAAIGIGNQGEWVDLDGHKVEELVEGVGPAFPQWRKDDLVEIAEKYIFWLKIGKEKRLVPWIEAPHPSDRAGRWKLYSLGLLPILSAMVRTMVRMEKSGNP
jgi:hypothetical protein